MKTFLLVNIKTILIIILIGIIVFQNWSRKTLHQGDVVYIKGKPYEVLKHVVDTVYKTKTKIVYRPGRNIYHDTTLYVRVPGKVDTTKLLKDFYVKNIYKDSLTLDEKLGIIIVTDTIYKNKLLLRKWDARINQEIINNLTIVKEPPVTQLYYGFNAGFGSSNLITSVSGGLILKTKSDHIYQINLGLSSSSTGYVPYIGTGLYWKIKAKK